MEKITSYGWPGNVRQLENVLKRSLVLCQGEWILEDQLLFEKAWDREEGEEDLSKKNFEDFLDTLFQELSSGLATSEGLDMISMLERGLILRALQKTGGNQLKAALLLGINRITLRGKMERYHIKKEVFVSEEANK
jgi:DNA-binding NtrC family response regulator